MTVENSWTVNHTSNRVSYTPIHYRTLNYRFSQWPPFNLTATLAMANGLRRICLTPKLSGSETASFALVKTDFTLETLVQGNLEAEIDQAFKNCEYNLKHAGGEGWSQVYRVVTYSTDIYSQHERIVYNLKKWMPNHQVVWTELGVNQLGSDKMHFEIDVEAYDPDGAAEAKKSKA
ncbi:putative L-PSP endoribonuclease family protein [Paramyrothecium foliicola]|nr:putative L-PSP endoribonuclease family protein [Paramyrothecium foliicola]